MDAERIIRSVAGPEDEGRRLDLWLSSRFSYLSRNQWQEEIKSGRIKINDAGTRSSRPLHAGDTISFYPANTEPPVVWDYRVIHEDPALLVIDKGGKLPCHPAGAYFRNTLWYDLSQKYGQVSIVNRLDRETSGLLIASRNSETAAALSAQFQDDTVEKIYHALVFGEFTRDLLADGYLSNDPASVIRKKRRFTASKPDGESEYAVTLFEPVGYYDGVSLVRGKPRTGRLHQVRATLYSFGFPLLGDKIYGPDDTCYLRFCDDTLTDEDMALLRMSRQALHASELTFRHPVSGKTVAFTSPLPCDFSDIMKK